MADDKKAEPAASSVKPLAVQVVDAIIDGAAAIAKSVVVETAERMGRSAAKTKAGKVASSLVIKAEKSAVAPFKKTSIKKALAKIVAVKKAVTKRKVAKKVVKKASKKSTSKKAR